MASDTLIDIGTLIVVDPDFRNGRPCIAGTGMSVHAVARPYSNGEPANEIAADFPDIPPSHIYAAIAYYLANRDAIDADLAADQAEADRLYEAWLRERGRSHS